MKLFRSLWIGGFLITAISLSGRAATLSGQVKDESNNPATHTQVVVPALQRGAQTDASGNYRLENIPPGNYTVEFRRLGYAPVTRQADLTRGDATLDVALSGTPLTLAPITITAAPEAKSTLNTPASVSVIEGRQLDRQRRQSVIGGDSKPARRQHDR